MEDHEGRQLSLLGLLSRQSTYEKSLGGKSLTLPEKIGPLLYTDIIVRGWDFEGKGLGGEVPPALNHLSFATKLRYPEERRVP